MLTFERQFQQNFDNFVKKWAVENAFKFSKTKLDVFIFVNLGKGIMTLNFLYKA